MGVVPKRGLVARVSRSRRPAGATKPHGPLHLPSVRSE